MPKFNVKSAADINVLKNAALAAAAQTATWITTEVGNGVVGVDLLKALRFKRGAYHPVTIQPAPSLLLPEHLNQLFTSLVVFEAGLYLFLNVPGLTELILRPGATSGGPDIIDVNGNLAVAECFAGDPFTLNPKKGMTKIAADRLSVQGYPGLQQFVFFHQQGQAAGPVAALSVPGVQVIAVAI